MSEAICRLHLSFLRLDPDVRVNVIPVDMVACQAVEIALSPAHDRIFHLSNAYVPTVGECLSAVFGSAGLMTPLFVKTEEELYIVLVTFQD